MLASLSSPQQQAKTEQAVEQKEMQLPTEKTKQMFTLMNSKETTANTTTQQQQANAAATTQTKPAATSSDKMKQLANSVNASVEQSNAKTVEKPTLKKDSITIISASAQQAQQKTSSAGSIIENKKLSSGKVKVPGDGEKKQ